MKLLEIPEIKNTCLIEPASILRVEAFSNYSKIYFANQSKTMLVSKVLSWVEDKLPPGMFVRIHRSHLINRQYVKGINGLQSKAVELLNGEMLAISRRRSTILLEQYFCKKPEAAEG